VYNAVAGTGGGALFISDSKMELINCVFTGNKSLNSGGAILSKNSELSIENNTFFQNKSRNASSVWNENSTINIINSILWNNIEDDVSEIDGGNFNVSFTCIRGGYAGEGNFSTSPEFINPNRPTGDDGLWGSLDDGLNISSRSSCIGTGSQRFPKTDILGFERSGSRSDVGAYAYKTTATDFLGIIKDGEFIPMRSFPVVDSITEERYLNFSVARGDARAIQVELPKNKHTDKKNAITANVVGLRPNGSQIGNPMAVRLFRVGNTQLFRSYYNNGNELFGKYIVFTSVDGIKGEFANVYAIHGAVDGQINISIPHNQFK